MMDCPICKSETAPTGRYHEIGCTDVYCWWTARTCPCESGEVRYELRDARDIFCSYVCSKCEDKVKSKYRPEIFTNNNYSSEEQIEEEY